MLLKNMKLLCAAMLAAGAMALNAAVPAMSLEYFYDKDGTIIGRSVNGEKFTYSYDKKGQLLSVKSLNGKVAEAYAYDPAGNILSKTIDGKTTYFKYDKANQLVSSTDPKGKVTNYEYDAAGRLVKEGDKEYKYSYLDKIVAVTEQGSTIATFDYYVDGQVASATQGGMQETFVWDGLALIQRNSTNYINEPAVTGGNPILADNKVLFNDMLGSTLGVKNGNNVESISRTAFGETASTSNDQFFTGKPHIGEMGYAFLFRNYRSDLGKWQTSDPLGYPDGWNNLAYVNNFVLDSIDFLGGKIVPKGTSGFNSFTNAVVNAAAKSNTAAGKAIKDLKDHPGGGLMDRNSTVVNEYTGGSTGYWPGTGDDLLGGSGANVTTGQYNYQTSGGDNFSPSQALLHELLHAYEINVLGTPAGGGNWTDSQINQMVNELMNDPAVAAEFENIANTYKPKPGVIIQGQGYKPE